ncbi:MAG: glycosyltransferase family 4 protein [Candidatus Cloacimonetes bacterium]|nr:glycosyltransferase family 4 protein [Candidatus Cloacimonadota bacterium]
MRILFVNTKFGFYGGVEKLLFKIAGQLRQNGHTIYGLFEQPPSDLFDFDTVFDKSYFYNGHSRAQLDELFGEFDIVFVHKATNPDLLEMLGKDHPVVVLVHDHDYYCLRRHKYYLWKRKNCHQPFDSQQCSICSMLLEKQEGPIPVKIIDVKRKTALFNQIRKAQAFIVLSDFMRDNLIANNFKPEKIHKIYPIIELPESIPEYHPDKPARLLYVGQMIRGKGVDLLIQAVSAIDAPYQLTLVGKGNEEENIKHLIRMYGIEDKTRFAGWVPDVESYYREADIVLVPSRWLEPFGMIGTEAYSRGKPVIAFNVGGISEWLRHGVTGLLAPEQNIDVFARHISTLIADPEQARQLGHNGFEMVKEHYSGDQFIEQFNDVLLSC